MLDIKQILALTKPLSLLYVEDDPDIRSQLEVIFQTFFGKVYVGTDGEEGLARYGETDDTIDLVITDIQMPKMTGLEMARAIRTINPQAHIIILTAHNELEFFTDAIEVGVEGFIIKPVQSRQLQQTLFKVSRTIRNEKELEMYHNRIETLLIETTEELEKTYTHDPLTDCYNREKLNKDLQSAKQSCLMLVNIDNFDSINSTYGYRIGDLLLKEFALFLKEQMPETQMLYRLAGDEFVILQTDACCEAAGNFSKKINDLLKDRLFIVEDCEIHITCTIGIADGVDEGNDLGYEEVLIKAHAAMEEIREIGKNRYHVYSADSSYIARQKNNIEWMHKVRHALEEDLITPYYQPIIDNQTLQPVKYECLSRMKDPIKVITPNYYIEPARLVGLLPRITEVMMTKAFAYFSGKDLGFTLNITEDDLKAGFMPGLLDQLSKRYDVKPSRVTLEILENVSAQGSDEVLEQLKQFKTLGFLLALDDFGSDKSNFYRLQKMDVDYIKIDGSFIKDITENSNNEKITKTIVHLAESLGCRVIAEFVHSQEVFEKVKALGIHYSQGYFFGEPKPDIIGGE